MKIRCGVIVARLLLVLALSWLTACSPKTPAPGPEATARGTGPSKTARPTFTPRPTKADPTVTSAKPTATSGATALAPSATPKAQAQSPTLPQPSPTLTPSPRPKKSLRMSSPEYGMQAFLWWRPEVASRDLQIIREAGFTWGKVGFGWRDIEGAAKGAFDWSRTDRIVEQANHEGIDLVVRVDHQPHWAGGGFPTNGPPDNLQHFADFLTALASRYRGRIRAYEVWNEPNLVREWGGKLPDPGKYVKMLKMAYAAIKAADPDAMVISAGLSPTGTWDDSISRPDDWYLESMYIAMGGNSDGYFDVLGAHGAGYKSPPERDPAVVAADPGLGGHRAFAFRRVEDLRAIMVKYGDGGKRIWPTEFGWATVEGLGVPPAAGYEYAADNTQAEQAQFLVRAYQMGKDWGWVGPMFLWNLNFGPVCGAGDEKAAFGIVNPSWSPRPAFAALRDMAK